MSILRFIEDYESDGVWFNVSQEYEIYDSYNGIADDKCVDCEPEIDFKQSWVKFYRFINPEDQKIYTVQEKAVTIIEQHTNTQVETSVQQDWDEKVTTDQIKTIYKKEDYVKAAKEFRGINIAAKERQDKADYAFPLSTTLL